MYTKFCVQKFPGRKIPAGEREMAENGLLKVVAASVEAVRVYHAAVDRVIEIPPPAVGADVVKLPLAAHSTKIIRPIRRALVRKYHQGKPVHARNGRGCAPQTCAHCHPSHPSSLSYQPKPVYAHSG